MGFRDLNAAKYLFETAMDEAAKHADHGIEVARGLQDLRGEHTQACNCPRCIILANLLNGLEMATGLDVNQ